MERLINNDVLPILQVRTGIIISCDYLVILGKNYSTKEVYTRTGLTAMIKKVWQETVSRINSKKEFLDLLDESGEYGGSFLKTSPESLFDWKNSTITANSNGNVQVMVDVPKIQVHFRGKRNSRDIYARTITLQENESCGLFVQNCDILGYNSDEIRELGSVYHATRLTDHTIVRNQLIRDTKL